MPLKTKAGIALVLLGIAVFCAWKAWTGTRNETPLDVPMDLIPGETISKNFRLNLDGLYLIEIAAADARAACLIGGSPNPSECTAIAPVIDMDWTVLREGQDWRRGTSAERHAAPVNAQGAVRVIGEFPGESGRDYQLRVSLHGDGRRLDPAHPYLRVTLSSIARSDFQSASVLAFSISFICVLFGTILLGISLFTRRSDDARPRV